MTTEMINEKEYAKIVSKNLRRIMYESQKTSADLSRDLNISKATISSWVNGTRVPRMKKMDMLCDYFHIKRTDLMEEHSAEDDDTVKAVRIPVYGEVAAGIPIEMITNIEDWEEIPAVMARGGEYFALRVHGDSMEPKISDGDVVIIRKQEDAESGDLVIATINGESATCKKLRKYPDGIALVSTNPAYEPFYFSAKEVLEKPVRILGKVVELRAKF